MAKKTAVVNPETLVRTVRTEGKKNVRYFLKSGKNFAPATRAAAYGALKAAGMRTTDAIAAITSLRSNPASSVTTTKSGVVKFA